MPMSAMIVLHQVEYEEDGSGAGGYAKEMSDGWKDVSRGLPFGLAEMCK